MLNLRVQGHKTVKFVKTLKFYHRINTLTHLTDSEKSPGELSLIRTKKQPSGCWSNNFSASARVILP